MAAFSGGERDSGNSVFKDEEWIHAPRGGCLQIQRHGRSATVHIWPSAASQTFSHAVVGNSSLFSLKRAQSAMIKDAPEQSLFESDVRKEIEAYVQPGSKKSRIMTSLEPQRTSVPISVEMITTNLVEPGKLEEAVNSSGEKALEMAPTQILPFSLMDEPSPLGLTLRKTPSLVDLIQIKLAQGELSISQHCDVAPGLTNRTRKSSPMQTTQQEKIKASNFPASTLKIGTWKWVSRYEGDLVAKCYYAKRKLVWEVLGKGLKSKIEIQWSDITALKASYPENEPGVLEIEVSRPPLFFKETNPQPRKHTLWQATSDFTGGQASICKWHYLRFSPEMLNRHYEKLMQCDARLRALNGKAVPSKVSPYFDGHSKEIEGQNGQKQFQLPQKDNNYPFIHLENHTGGCLPSFLNPQTVQGSSETHHCGPDHNLEAIELELQMADLASKSSSPVSTAMNSQGFRNSRRKSFDFIENMEASSMVECTTHNSEVDNLLVRWLHSDTLFSECNDIQRPSCSTSVTRGDAKFLDRRRLNDIAYHLLGEHFFPTISGDRLASEKLNFTSLVWSDAGNVSDLPVSDVSTDDSLFSAMQRSACKSLQELGIDDTNVKTMPS